ncbi:MAG: type II secretion system F family protein [Planctomycetota bacterium]
MSALILAFSMSSFALPALAFILFAAAAWLLIDMLTSRTSNTEQRLDEFKDPTLRKRKASGARGGGDGLSTEGLTHAFEKASPTLSKPLQPKNEKEVGKLKQRLTHAGFRSEAAPAIFLSLKFALLLLGLLLGGGFVFVTSQLNDTVLFEQKNLFKCIGIAAALFYLPELVLMWLTKRRTESIFLGLPDALDLMVVCVEAGLALDQAMRRVSEEMEKSFPTIAEEFGLCNLQLQMGRSRADVLKELGKRSGVDDLRSLASILIQADRFGSSIAQALRVQSDSMRTRRQQIAEEKAAKTAVKLIFPLVIFIFPGIFVVLVGPAAITMVREMFPAMSGS